MMKRSSTNYRSRRRSPFRHNVHTRHPRYSVPNYMRGRGEPPTARAVLIKGARPNPTVAPAQKARRQNPTDKYLNEVVMYGGLPTRRGDMILHLQKTAKTRYPGDKRAQQRLVDIFLMGHSNEPWTPPEGVTPEMVARVIEKSRETLKEDLIEKPSQEEESIKVVTDGGGIGFSIPETKPSSQYYKWDKAGLYDTPSLYTSPYNSIAVGGRGHALLRILGEEKDDTWLDKNQLKVRYFIPRQAYTVANLSEEGVRKMVKPATNFPHAIKNLKNNGAVTVRGSFRDYRVTITPKGREILALLESKYGDTRTGNMRS